MDMLRSLGVDHVIDYAQQDFTTNGEKYDVIIDVVGKRYVARRLGSLNRGGYYFLANAWLSHVALGWWASLTRRKHLVLGASSQTREDLLFLKDLIETNRMRPIVDRSYSLEQIPEAHRFIETGQKLGNVAITVAKE